MHISHKYFAMYKSRVQLCLQTSPENNHFIYACAETNHSLIYVSTISSLGYNCANTLIIKDLSKYSISGNFNLMPT